MIAVVFGRLENLIDYFFLCIMAPKNNKTPQSQKKGKDKKSKTNAINTRAQSTQTTDIKEFFQQLQSSETSQGLLNIIESSTTLGTTEEKEMGQFRNSSPIYEIRPIIETDKLEKEKWDMKAYICSLPTKEDMDQYVFRLENSYKTELQELKTSIQNTQEKEETIDVRMAAMELKMAQEEGIIK